jgi:tyrosyl-tRNA synthetase
MNLYDELEARGLLFQCTAPEELKKRLEEGPITVYSGYDPSSDSLHIGNLVSLLTLARFQRAGHKPIAVAGGATGMIGDPGGKSEERNLLPEDVLAANVASIKQEIERFLDFSPQIKNPARLVDNADWTKGVSMLTFLRDIGKSFSVNDMMRKESVRARLEDREQGISYTEFSYMLLQAFDFLHLFETYNCELQAGGSDQWGNITAGIELIRKKHQKQSFGLTTPLVTDSQGKKFGKSVKGALFLSPKKTSPYHFYQFWIRTLDADVINYLKIFTFLPLEEIETLAKEVVTNPGQREAQKRLAVEMTLMVHGEELLESVKRATEALFGGSLDGLSEQMLLEISEEAPRVTFPKARLAGEGVNLVDFLIETKIMPSKREARDKIGAGAVYLNNQKQPKENAPNITDSSLLFDKYILARKGKRDFCLVIFE